MTLSFKLIPDSDILTHPEWFPDIVNSLNSINKVLQKL